MSDSAAAVRGLLADIDRVSSAVEAAFGQITEQADARVREVERERDAMREGERGARTRAEQAEQATAILRDEREVIRDALRSVTQTGTSAKEGSP